MNAFTLVSTLIKLREWTIIYAQCTHKQMYTREYALYKKSFNFLAYEGMYNINGSQDRFNVIYEAFDCLLTKIGNHVAAFLDTNWLDYCK